MGGIIFVLGVFLGGYILVNAWNYTDLAQVSTSDTLTADRRNAIVESLFWKRDGVNDISFTVGNASVNAPSADAHIATKKYVDDSVQSGGDNLGNHTATQNIDANNNKMVNLATPTLSTDAATKAYVDNNVGQNLQRNACYTRTIHNRNYGEFNGSQSKMCDIGDYAAGIYLDGQNYRLGVRCCTP